MSLSDREKSLHRALEKVLAEHSPDFDERAAVLTGYVVVTEWSDEKGERWLAATETPGMPTWQARGMLHERLYMWSDGD